MSYSVQSQFLSNSNHSDYLTLFRDLSTEYSDYAREAGVELIAFRDPSLPLFSLLSDGKKKEVLSALTKVVKICRDTKAQGHSMGDSPALIWQALKEFGLRPPSDLFGQMHDCTVVEVYSQDNIQVFRSFSFFRYCSYSLEDLYCEEWLNLFARDDNSIIPMVISFMKDVYQGVTTFTTNLRHIPKHIVRETYSPFKYKLQVGINWGAPLFEEGTSTPVATIFLETGELIEKSDGLEQSQPRAPRPIQLVPSPSF